jgi:ATP diphosphatase
VSGLDRLLDIMARLRDPEHGCPWDLEQDFASIAPYTIEEAYEVADAIARADMEDLQDELGDLLLQVVYHARIAEERGLFAFEDVARVIAEKLVRRHPHVFSDPAGRSSVTGVVRTWETTKAAERASRRARRIADGEPDADGPFDDIPIALPSLLRAAKILKRAERVGGVGTDPVVGDRAGEDRVGTFAGHAAEAAATQDPGLRAEHVGDLLLAVVAWAGQLGIDPERALADRTRALEARARASSAD